MIDARPGWVCPPLPVEIVEKIMRSARRPLPHPGRPAQWKQLHQSSLARCMRVNKLFNTLAAPLLYDTVVFNDLPAFTYGLADEHNDGAEYTRVSKLDSLSYVNRIFIEDPNTDAVRSLVGVFFAPAPLQYLDKTGKPPRQRRDGSVTAHLLAEWRDAALALAHAWTVCRPAAGGLSRPLGTVSYNCWMGRHNMREQPRKLDDEYVAAMRQLANALDPDHVCMHSGGIFASAPTHAWPVVVDKCRAVAVKDLAPPPASESPTDMPEPSETTPSIALLPNTGVTVHVLTNTFHHIMPYNFRPFGFPLNPVSSSATTVCYDLAHAGPKMFCSQGPAWLESPRNALGLIVRGSFTRADKHTYVRLILPMVRQSPTHGSADRVHDWDAGWRDAWTGWFDRGMQYYHLLQADKRLTVDRAQDAPPCMACGAPRDMEEAVARRSVIPLELGKGIYDFVRSYNWRNDCQG